MTAMHDIQALCLSLAVRLTYQCLLDMAAVHESRNSAAPAGPMGRMRTARASPEVAGLSCAHVRMLYI